MKNTPLVALVMCASLFIAPALSSQSLYHDARQLAEILQNGQSPRVADSLWFRLSYSTPFVTHPALLGKTALDTISSLLSYGNKEDFLVVNDGEYPDELIVFNKSTPEKILFSTLVKYNFCILQISEDGNLGKLNLLAPSGISVAFFADSALLHPDIVITNRKRGNIRFYACEGWESSFSLSRFTNSHQTLEPGLAYTFPDLSEKDTLWLKSDKKIFLKAYRKSAGNKIVLTFPADSIYTIVNGDWWAERKDSMELSGPFPLFSLSQSAYLLLHIPERGMFFLEKKTSGRAYELEMKSGVKELEVHGGKNDGAKLHPDRVRFKEIDRFALSSLFQYTFDQINLYNGSMLIKTVHLTDVKAIDSIRFNVLTKEVELSLLRNIRKTDPQYASYRKKYQLKLGNQITLMGHTLRFDYAYSYSSYYDENLGGEFEEPGLADFNKFRLNLREIQPRRDTAYTIDLYTLANFHFKENTLYFVEMDTAVARQNMGGLDFSDVWFSLDYNDQASDPFRWYPALNPVLEIFVKDTIAHIFYAPAITAQKLNIPIFKNDSLPILLGVHAELKTGDLQSPYLWGDISDKYRDNPLLASYLENDLAHTRFEPLPGLTNDQLRKSIADQQDAFFAWQKVLFDNAQLQMDDQVAYDKLVNTYRARIPTASDKLQTASEQFNNEAQKLHKGLNATNLAIGLSDFIVERAQEELNLTFLNRLRDRVQRDSEFIILFPQTVKMMADFRIEQYRTLLDFAKSAFVQDLRNLGVTFPRLFGTLSKYQRLQNDPKVYNLFLLYDIANKVYENTPVDKVLLHMHNRLHERQTSLSESINQDLGKKLRQDTLIRPQLSRYVLAYESALEQFTQKKEQLETAFMQQWESLSAEMQQFGVSEETRLQMDAMKIREPQTGRKKTADPAFSQYRFASANLLGDPGYEYLKHYLEFNRFKDFFSKQPDVGRTVSLGLAQADVLLSASQTAGINAYMREMEEKIATLQMFRNDLETRRATSINSLSGYMPLLKKYKMLMIRRASLGLALKTELDHHTGASQHEIESLRYLQTVLQTPEQYRLYTWSKLDSFGRSLASFNASGYKLTSAFSILPGTDAAKGQNIGLYDGYRLLTVVSSEAAEIEAEMEAAQAFLDNMATTMREHFTDIKPSRAATAILNDSIWYHGFLFSSKMTDESVVLDYEGLMQNMDVLIEGKKAADNTLLEQAMGEETIRKYKKLRVSTIIKPVMLTGNQFLDFNDQPVLFEPSQTPKDTASGLAQAVESIRSQMDALEKISKNYTGFLTKVKADSVAAPLAALDQALQFDALVGNTLLWLYAFRNEAAPGDSTIIVRDTFIGRNTLLLKSGKQVAYDSIWVVPRVKGVHQWMTLSQFNQMMEDAFRRKAFLGLLYQRLNAVQGNLEYNPSNLALLATKFINTVYEIDEARAILNYKQNKGNAIGFQDYYPFIRSSVDMLNVVLETPLSPGDEPLKKRYVALQDLPDLSNESLSLFENIFAENYGNAIRNVVQLLSITWGLRQKDKNTASGSGKNKKDGKPIGAPSFASVDLPARRENEKIKSALLTYGTFMANMVEAQTPDQVKAAISAVAVPPGSSSIKRNARLHLGVNGYFGLGFHQETLTADSISNQARGSCTIGLSVPVGISVSMGQWRIGKYEHSFSLFLPVFDLGAVTSYRLNQQKAPSELPELTFGNIVSPGAYLLYNIPRSPFTIGGGAQFGPQLRKVTVDGNQINSSAWRYGLTCSIDVPFFNLYTQQERKIKKKNKS